MKEKQTYDKKPEIVELQSKEKKQEIVDLQSKIDQLEKKISRLEKNNKELKDESERHKRMAMYMEGRYNDLWGERIIMLKDILRFQKRIDDYSIANDELLEANSKLSKKLEDATGKKYDPNLFIDASTQTDPVDNNQAKTCAKRTDKNVNKNY